MGIWSWNRRPGVGPGRFFNFNGTAGLWRKRCIGESGGWQHDTLTEDLDLSYRAQLRGWKFVFLADIVTPAELPVDIDGFKSQQHRWTKGSIQTCKKLLPRIWRSKLPFFIKVEATAHLTANFAYLLLACLCVLLHPFRRGQLDGCGWRGSRPAGRSSDLCGHYGLDDSLLSLRPKRTASESLEAGDLVFCRLSWRWELACRLTMPEPFWKRSSIEDRISVERRNTASKGPSNSGKAVAIPQCGR